MKYKIYIIKNGKKIFIFFFFILNINRIFSLLNLLNTKKPKISVFLPIYNSENFITKTIQSLQEQTLKNIEIIAINDYSKDNTLNILNKLANNDNRIKIINNDKNYGLLYSRAMGILNSKAEYIMNLDSDDLIYDKGSLEYLYNTTKIYNPDILSFYLIKKKNNLIYKCKYKNKIQRQPKLFKSIFWKNNYIIDYLITNKLIKKEVFLKAYEFLKKYIYKWKWNYFEDDIWNILVHRYAKSKICLNRLVYIYNYNNNSLTEKKYRISFEIQNLLYRHELYYQLFNRKEEKKYFIAEYFWLINSLITNKNNILLTKDNYINKLIKNVLNFFIDNYNCSAERRNKIKNFLKELNIKN